MNTRSFLIPLALAVAALTTACGPQATLRTPAGFAALEDQEEYVYRATSAEGVVLAVRGEKNKPRANLDFWADAIDRQLRSAGYEREGQVTDVRSAAGLQGRQMKYTRDENGRKSRFWSVVFVTGTRVWVVEAGGDDERFKGKAQDIQKAVESLSLG